MQRNKRFRTIRRLGRRAVSLILKLFGEEVESLSLESALLRCQTHTPSIQSVLDVGASDGRWTRICREYYTSARYLLIEAQQPHRIALQKLISEFPDINFIIAAAGDSEGMIFFDASDLLGGIASHNEFKKNNIVVPMTTIDHQVKNQGLKPPFLIKLDTHGFEIPILKGAAETLKKTELVIIEAYNFNFSDENVRFHQIVAHMEMLGFRCVDMSDPLHRPGDHALFQFDLYFIPSSHLLFDQRGYSKETYND